MLNEITLPVEPPHPTKSPKIKLWVGTEVLLQLEKEDFKKAWKSLYEQCPWATVYQSFGFVSTWYHIYHQHYLPLLLTQYEGNSLTGVLALCKDDHDSIVGAGLNQAEYQTWLLEKNDQGGFIQKALTMLLEKFPAATLQLKYIPEKTPINDLKSNPYWEKSCWIQEVSHPIMHIDGEKLGQELRKKNKRGKVNHLKRLGELSFEQIEDDERFEEVFDELATQNDFRKGAVYNASYFQDTSLSKCFLLELFKQKLLHATVLKVNEEIIASNVGAMGKGWVHLQGINTHAPSFAKHSPGIIHFLMLGQHLAKSGFKIFDLTPGSDAYKESLATDHLTAYTLYIDKPGKVKSKKQKFHLTQKTKSLLAKAGFSPHKQRVWKRNLTQKTKKLQLLKSQPLGFIVQHLLEFRPVKKTFRIHSAKINPLPGKMEIRKNCLADLLKFQPGRSSLKLKWEFLEEAMKMLEEGKECYTAADKKNLLACIWAEPVRKDNSPKTHAVLLKDLYLSEDAKVWLLPLVAHTYQKMVNAQNGIHEVLLETNGKTQCLVMKEAGYKPVVK